MEKTTYGYWKKVDYKFDDTIERISENLNAEGFGVLSDLDFKMILKEKLNVDFKQYRVLLVCNPPSAYELLQSEEQIGLLLPCNVVVYVNDNNETIVSIVDPVINMANVDNEVVHKVATVIKSKLKDILTNL